MNASSAKPARSPPSTTPTFVPSTTSGRITWSWSTSRARLSRGLFPIDQTLKYAAQICDALDAAHKKGITHRDLKPANILVTKAGIKLLDFGLAKLGTSGIGQAAKPPDDATLTMALTGKNEIVGTLYYMSPEQLQAQATGQEIDGRSDIFSFGLVLYEMLTGKRAFEGSSPASVIAAIMERPAPSIADVAPVALDRLLKCCLAKDPDDRWQTARDLKAELEWIASASESGIAVPAASDSSSRLGRLPWIAAGVLAVSTAVALWAPWRAEKSAERKPLIRMDVSLGPDAVAGPVAISPDGARIVFPIRGADGKQMLATRLLDQAVITLLPGTGNGANAFFSPDGQSIGFTADSNLKKISFSGGAPVTVADASSFLGASWGENGDIVAKLKNVGGLQRIPAAGGAANEVTNPVNQESLHAWPQVLPGGDAVLFTGTKTASLEDATIQVVSLKTGSGQASKAKTLVNDGYFGRYVSTNGAAGSGGYLIYVRQGVLYAVAFDPVGLTVRGGPEQILGDVTGISTFPFDFSRSGVFVYHPGIAADEKWPVVWLESSGKTEPLVTTPGTYSWPRFSPDGKRLAFTNDSGKGREIFVYDRPRDALSRLTSAGAVNHSPVWSRDGEHLVFEARSAADSRLSWIRADGSGESQILLESKKSFIRPTGFSPDGRTLAYMEVKPEGDVDVWTLPMDTSDPEHPKPGKPAPFLQTPATEVGLVFSPDGRYVAYYSNDSGSYEVYVRPAPEPDGKPAPGKWQISTGGGSWPQWSPAGHELFYHGLDNRIMVTDYTAAGGSFSSTKPRAWSDRQIRQSGVYLSFAIAPDGKRIAVFPMPEPTTEDKGPGHVTFLLNFFDELRRRVPSEK